MQRHWFFKLLAFVVAMVSGAALMLGAVGLLLGDEVGGYRKLRGNVYNSQVYQHSLDVASRMVEQHNWKQSGLSLDTYNRFFGYYDPDETSEYGYCYKLYRDGEEVVNTLPEGVEYAWIDVYDFHTRTGTVRLMPPMIYYPPFGEEESAEYLPTEDNPAEENVTMPPQTPTDPTVATEVPEGIAGVVDYDYYWVPAGAPTSLEDIDPDNVGERHYYWVRISEDYQGTVYRIEYTQSVHYQVHVFYTEQQLAVFQEADLSDEPIYGLLQQYRELIPRLAIFGGIGLAVSILWLCLVAGRKPGSDEVKPDGLNRIPLDLYLVGTGAAIVGGLCIGAEYLYSVVRRSVFGYYDSQMELWLDVTLYGLLGGAIGLILAMFLMACAAQMKQGENRWLKNSLIGTCIHLCRLVGWEAVKGIWKITKVIVLGIGRFFARCVRAVGRLHGMLPLVWQWLLASGGLWLLMLVGFLEARHGDTFLLILTVLLTIGVVLYGSYCFGKLRISAREMATGKLDSKINDQLILGCFRDFSNDLNALSDTCVKAAKEQMKSERMKSELITNVSHDIKTPLTSIINYVDLLQKAENDDQRKEYLEVLDRQSQKLKKLIEDLMEMSKANSGNMAVEIVPTDVGEAVNQALGEFADRFELCGLTIMCRLPKEPLMAMCDGKLLWRVLSNCFGNVVKYAMPGTRVYVDAAKVDDHVELSIKNISAQMLNITAEELMERFVRGDASRNTEGNGLGLNIARSLMEVQGGTLNLMVDGDLFKVVLTIPAAE